MLDLTSRYNLSKSISNFELTGVNESEKREATGLGNKRGWGRIRGGGVGLWSALAWL